MISEVKDEIKFVDKSGAVTNRTFGSSDFLAHSQIIEKCETFEDLIDAVQKMYIPLFDINSYKTLEKLGVGGFGIVVKVMDYETQRNYALKTLDLKSIDLQNWSKSEIIDAFKIFLNDINILRTIASDLQTRQNNVIKFKTCFYEEEKGKLAKLHILMEQGLCNLEELLHFLSKKKRKGSILFNELEICIILFDITNALVYLEKKNIYHSDIKPGNIVMTEDGFKIVDFGVSKIINTDPTDLKKNVMYAGDGTLEYASPELKNTEEFSPFLSDVYSLGLTIRKIMTPMHYNNKSYSNELFELVEEMINHNWKMRPNFRQINSFAMNKVRILTKYTDANTIKKSLCDNYMAYHSTTKKFYKYGIINQDLTERLIKLSNKTTY